VENNVIFSIKQFQYEIMYFSYFNWPYLIYYYLLYFLVFLFNTLKINEITSVKLLKIIIKRLNSLLEFDVKNWSTSIGAYIFVLHNVILLIYNLRTRRALVIFIVSKYFSSAKRALLFLQLNPDIITDNIAFMLGSIKVIVVEFGIFN